MINQRRLRNVAVLVQSKGPLVNNSRITRFLKQTGRYPGLCVKAEIKDMDPGVGKHEHRLRGQANHRG
jgi:hypothetical protein